MSKKFFLPLLLTLAMCGCNQTATSSSQVDTEPAQTLTVQEALQIGSSLEKNEITTETYIVEGECTGIKYAWDDEYKNISFNMGDLLVYRVKMAENVNYTDIEAGVTITVEGKLQNYQGTTVELVQGTVTKIEAKTGDNGGDNGGETPAPSGAITPEEAMAIGTALGKDEITTESYTVHGEVTGIKYAWDDSYQNISFFMGDFLVYRTKVASGVDHTKIVIGATVTVEGKIQNYYGNTVELINGTVTAVSGSTGGNGGSAGGDNGGNTGTGGTTDTPTGAHSIAFNFAEARTQVAAYDAGLKDQAQDITVNNVSYLTKNCYNSSSVKTFMLGAKKYSSASLVANKTAISGDITEVQITFPKGSSAKAEYAVEFGTSALTSVATSSTVKAEGELDANGALAVDVVITFTCKTAGAKYFSLSCVNTKYNGQITSITVYYN